MLIFSICIILFLIFAIHIIISIRFGSSGRTLGLKLICSLQGIPSIVLNSNSKLCKAVLDSSNTKGHGLEMYFALPGWLPIYNSESVDGELWRKLLSIFRKIVHKLNYSERLPAIIKKHCIRINTEF